MARKSAAWTGKTGALAALAVLLAAGTASADRTAWGGGGAEGSRYVVRAFNCFGTPQDLISSNGFVSVVAVPQYNYIGTQPPAQDCSDPAQIFAPANALHYDYKTVGGATDEDSSGVAIFNLLSHEPQTGSLSYGDIDPTGSLHYMPYISYGVSEIALTQTAVGFWNTGNDDNGPSAPSSVPVHRVTMVGPGETAHPPTSYPNPLEHYGPLVQVPLAVEPVAIAYDPVYKKTADANGIVTSYRFNIRHPHADGSGGLRLSQTVLCEIFNGQITDWNNSEIMALNGNQSLRDPTDPDTSFSVPLQIAGMDNAAGINGIFTRHLARICGTTGINLAGNKYADGSVYLPASLYGASYDGSTPVWRSGKFVESPNLGTLAEYIAFDEVPARNTSAQQGVIGYIFGDYVAPYNGVSGLNVFNLNTADLRNQSNRWRAMTVDNAVAAYSTLSPAQSHADGTFDPAVTCVTRCRIHPYDWVESLSKTSQLAAPTTTNAYPIVGSLNLMAYTCYADADVAKVMNRFLAWYMNKPTALENPDGIFAHYGLAPIPDDWRTAVVEAFSTGDDHLGLEISAAGSGAACANATGG